MGFMVHGFSKILSSVTVLTLIIILRKMGDVTAENSAVPCHDRNKLHFTMQSNYNCKCYSITLSTVFDMQPWSAETLKC